jgi:hypothetical protein
LRKSMAARRGHNLQARGLPGLVAAAACRTEVQPTKRASLARKL